jgi:queuine tRNA-ribosyltransferase
MPVGTLANVKTVTPDQLATDSCPKWSWLIPTTYTCNQGRRLWLRPAGGDTGLNRVGKGTALTDSGGFQVFSLSQIRTITEAGVAFKSAIRN